MEARSGSVLHETKRVVESAMSAKGSTVSEPSSLLSSAENESVFAALGNKRQSKATAVVQLYHAHPKPRMWSKVRAGVLCFVKDNPKKSYYFRLVDLATRTVVFEQEMYDQLWYRRELPHFHIFPGDKFMVGLNFADEGEAEQFYDAVNTKLSEKKRRDTIKRNPQQQPTGGPSSPTSVPQPTTGGGPPQDSNIFAGTGSLSSSSSAGQGGKKKRKKITKADISGPSNFVHLAHVGWDPNTGSFDSSNISPEWKRLLDTVGVTETELQDQDTARFIHDFVQQHGGIEEATRQLEESNQVQAPPPPARTSSRSAAPPPPNRGRGPPPPPQRGSGPAPPPPPPVPGPPGPPPPPSSSHKQSNRGPALSQPPSGRSALLESIRGGKKLNKVDESDINDRSGAHVGGSSSGASSSKPGGMAGALAQALARRQQFIQASDDESEEEEEDEDWED